MRRRRDARGGHWCPVNGVARRPVAYRMSNPVWCEDHTTGAGSLSSTTIDLAQERSPTSILRWYVLILTCLIYAINIADRYVVSTVLEPIRLELHLNDKGVAFLTGTPLALFYVAFGIPISWCADRMNRRNILAVVADHLVGVHHLVRALAQLPRIFARAHRRRRRRSRAGHRPRPPSCRIIFRQTGGRWR